MMFMIPIPAAINAIELITPAPARTARVSERNWRMIESLDAISKSSSAPGSTLRRVRRIPRTCPVSSAAGTGLHLDGKGPFPAVPVQPVVIGTSTKESWSCPKAALSR
jgi:hypothetical protein